MARTFEFEGHIATSPTRSATAPTHDLRHSAAVAWLTAGVQVAQVSRWLGHAQLTITLNGYRRLGADSLDNPLPEPVPRNVVVPMHGAR